MRAERCWAEMVELRPSLEVVMTELENLQKTLCPQGQDSEMITCKVYPTRQKSLAEALARQQQIEAQAKQAKLQAQSSITASGHGSQGRPQSPNPPLKSALKRGSNNMTPQESFGKGKDGKSEGNASPATAGSVQVMPKSVMVKDGAALSPESSSSRVGFNDPSGLNKSQSVAGYKPSPLAFQVGQ
jgi:hypothetical protein